MTLSDIANNIQKLDPDLKEFWKITDKDQELNSLLGQPYSDLNFLKIELLAFYLANNSRMGLPINVIDTIKQYYQLNFSIDLPYRTHTLFIIHRKTLPDYTLVSQISNINKYLNPFLRSALNLTVSTKIDLKLEPNEFSYMLFLDYLKTKKSLNSVQAINFINKIKFFEAPIRFKYADAILSHCPKPSIELQKLISERNYGSKYVSYNKDRHNSSIYSTTVVFGSSALFDTCYSMYKPFVANLTAAEITQKTELSNLIDGLLAIKQHSDGSNYDKPLYESMSDYVKTKTDPKLLEDYISRLHIAKTAFEQIIKDLT